MRVSKRAVAREWLIFSAALPLGFPACFFLGYYWENFRNAYFSSFYLSHHGVSESSAFDAFWNDAFGLGNVSSLALWLVPYVALTLLRSIWWSARTLSSSERAKPSRVLHPLLIICLITVVSFGAMFLAAVFQNARRDAAIRAEKPSPSPTVTTTPTTVHSWDSFLAEHGSPSPSRTPMRSEMAPIVTPIIAPDLKKITLFDVGVQERHHFGRTSYAERGIFEFHGRVRNQLPRAVENVVIKASVYNPLGELIEVKTFRLDNTRLEPGAPASFSHIVGIQYLPEGYKYQLEVVEAHYVK